MTVHARATSSVTVLQTAYACIWLYMNALGAVILHLVHGDPLIKLTDRTASTIFLAC